MAVKLIYTNAYGDSLEFSKESAIRITDIDGLSANDISLSESTVTNQVGSSVTGASVQSKSMTIEGRYKYSPAIRKRLLAVVLPAVTATLRYINTVEDIDVYWEGQPTKTPDISKNPIWQTFQFVMKLPYPYPRLTEAGMTAFSSFNSAFRFPQAYSSAKQWKISSREVMPLQTINNRGDIDAGFTVEFKAILDFVIGPKLLNVDTQESIYFPDLRMHIGDILRVCTKPNQREAVLIQNGVETNAFKYMDYNSVFFLLKRGENVIRYSAQTEEEGLDVTLSFDEVLAGV